MKAITIWQPWAYMLIVGLKRYETRSWKTNYRGPLAIHAAAKADSAIKQTMDINLYNYLNNEVLLYHARDLPRGCVVGVCELVECHKIDADFMKSLNSQEKRFGNFVIGGYAWQIKNMSMLANPIYIKGQQRLWEWRKKGEENGMQIL